MKTLLSTTAAPCSCWRALPAHARRAPCPAPPCRGRRAPWKRRLRRRLRRRCRRRRRHAPPPHRRPPMEPVSAAATPPSPHRGRRRRGAAAGRARLRGRWAGSRRTAAALRLSRGVHARPLRRLAVAVVPRRAVAVLPAHRHRRVGLRRGSTTRTSRSEDRRTVGRRRSHAQDFLQQGRILLRVTPTYSAGNFFVQAQAEIVANKDQSQTQPQPSIVDADDAWVRIGEWAKWVSHARPLRGVRDLLPRHGSRRQHAGAAGRVRRQQQPARHLRRDATCSIGRAAPATSRFTSIRTVPARRAARAVRRPGPVQRDRRPAGDHLRHRLAEAERGRRIPVAHGEARTR